MKYSLLILFVLTPFIVKSQIELPDCFGEYAIYYTTSKVFIYQNMDSESAIKRVIPKGEKVYIISSSFGKITGFWEICYKGSKGYVKKSQLSYKKTSSASAQKKDNIEFGSLSDLQNKIDEARKAAQGPEPKKTEVIDGMTIHTIETEGLFGKYDNPSLPWGGDAIPNASEMSRLAGSDWSIKDDSDNYNTTLEIARERKKNENIRDVLFVVIPLLLITIVGVLIYKILK